jgi:hypothetical protein
MNGEIIPDGTFAKVTMAIRPGGIDGQSEIDQALLKAPKDPASDVRMVDGELTVVEGPHARRKFWQMFTVQGGKVDESGVSIGGKITKSIFRAMIDSALGLAPDDMSEAAKEKRVLRGLADLDGITFVAKITVEHNPPYKDKNKLDRVVLPNEKEWLAIMRGETAPPSVLPSVPPSVPPATLPSVPPSPSHRAQTPSPPAQAPAWRNGSEQSSSQTKPQPQQKPAAKPGAPAQSKGPAWLKE